MKTTTVGKKFAVSYVRVSTALQEEQQTVENQRMSIKEYALKNNFDLIGEYADLNWSGDTLARPELDRLRLDAEKRLWDTVIIYDPDRLARRGAWQEVVMEHLKDLGVQVLFVTLPPPKDEWDTIMHKMRGVFTEYERMKIKERFRLGKVSRVRNNHVLTTEAPYGYKYIKNVGQKGKEDFVIGHYIVNEKEAEVVKMIFAWVGINGYTLRRVVRELLKMGIMPRKSKRGVWNTSTLSTMLRHKVYIGQTHWGASYAVIPVKPLKFEKYKKNKKTSRRVKEEKDWTAIITSVPAIISEELFKRVGEQLKSNYEQLGRNKKNDYLLAGRIYCSCGHRRAGEGSVRKNLYYRCTNRQHNFPLPPTCSERGINARITDEVIWNRIKQIMSSPELLSKQIELWANKSTAKEKAKSDYDIEITKKKILKLRAQEDRLVILYSNEIIGVNKFMEHVEPIRKNITECENEINRANLENSPKSGILLPSKDEIDSFAKKAVETLENADFSFKQSIIRQTVNKVLAETESLQVYGYINTNQLDVVFRSEYRNRRLTKCRQINIIQCTYKKECISCQLSICHYRSICRRSSCT